MDIGVKCVCGADIARTEELLRVRLSKKRFQHSMNVSAAAVQLADKYGEDREKAYLAGMVHDICKEIPQEEQLKMALACGRDFSPLEARIAPLCHAAAGAWYCENVLCIHDKDVLNAVRYHTAARADMSPLEEIIYIADLISADRSYKDVDRMRRLAFESLKGTMLEALKFSISDIIKKGSYIPECTFGAYNYYAEIISTHK